MDANITSRLGPLIDSYRQLTSEESDDIERAEELVEWAVDGGYFSIPVMEAALAVAKKRANVILCDDIPALLAEYGLSKAILEDGTEITKDTFWEVSQSGKDKEELASWLTLNGYESAIKDTFEFEKGSNLSEVISFLDSEGVSYDRRSEVHSQTLKKIIKDHYTAHGKLPPESAVKVSIFDRGVVKAAKKGKGF